MKKLVSLILSLALIAPSFAQSTNPNQGVGADLRVAVDPRSITDQKKYEDELLECKVVATRSYDKSDEKIGDAALGAVAGGAAVAGVATAVAGAIFLPALPFILGGAALGGVALGGKASKEQREVQEKILAQCLTERGYKAYSLR